MKSTLLFLAPLLLAAADLGAQAADAEPPVPACAEGGVSRVAVTVPEGQPYAEFVQMLQESGAFPPGTQVKILQPYERPRLVNWERLRSRGLMHIHRFMRTGLEVDGLAQAVLEVDADGVVTAVHPSSGHREVDRALRDLWRHARYEPMVVGQCRVPAWLHVGFDVESQFEHEGREVEFQTSP